MTILFRRIAPLPVLALSAACAAWAAPEPRATKVDLISETRAVTPGRPFYVGVQMKLPKGWHTYWKNPGDSGLPPRVSWKLPPGFQAGPIEWPAPDRFAESDLMTYGYDDELVLPVRISAPERIEGDSVRIEGTVDWLECKDVCVSGTAPVALSLAVSPKAGSSDPGAGSIEAARERVPGPPAGWAVTAEAGPRAISLVFDPPEGISPKAAYFYVEQPLVIEHAKPQGFEPSGNGYRLTMTPALNAVRNPSRLTGVLLVEGSGLFRRRSAVQIDVPVVSGDPAPAPMQQPGSEPPNLGSIAAIVALTVGLFLFLRRRMQRPSQST